LRTGPLVSPMHLLHLLFKAFDMIPLSLDWTGLSSATILTLLLQQMFTNVPLSHWIHHRRHRHLQASIFFFCYDDHQLRFRPKVDHEFQYCPRLCRRLFKQVFNKQV
ncbi:uncharacterized protein BX664DRAFT_236851, partial [Halteromyces radiatus]|uniref:uncharacterized protein n=1 Tax=Halteromyces radiatus TaxID=101107 RepID=UPI00221FB3EA